MAGGGAQASARSSTGIQLHGPAHEDNVGGLEVMLIITHWDYHYIHSGDSLPAKQGSALSDLTN